MGIKPEQREKLESMGYEILEEHRGKWNYWYIIFKDRDGYKHDSYIQHTLNGKISRVGKNNPFSLENISLWLKLNNKNFELCNDNVYIGTHKNNLKFHCFKCDDYFYSDWANISSGWECPICSGHKINKFNNLEYLRPDLVEEWNPKNKLKPNEVTLHSGKKISWVCLKCNYGKNGEWVAKVSDRTDLNSGCPACSGLIVTDKNRLSILYPEIAKEWHPIKNGKIKSTDVSFGSSNKKYWWLCSKCEFEWMAKVNDRTGSSKSGCPNCYSRSKGEDEIKIYLNKYSIFYSYQHRFSDCRNKKPLPFDFYLSDQNICIEYHGPQHYKPINFFGGRKQFNLQKKLDKIKLDYCKKNKIKIIIIPYRKNVELILSKEIF